MYTTTIIKFVIDVILVSALLYGYSKEEKIIAWEQEVFFPYIKKLFKGDVKNDRH